MNEIGPPGRPFPFPGEIRPFNCTAAMPPQLTDERNITESPIALCPVGLYAGKQPPNIHFSGYSYWTWIVLKTLGTHSDWSPTTTLKTRVAQENEDEWLGFRSAQSDAGLDLSVCFTNFDDVEAPVTAWRDRNFTEPDLGWISSSRKYNTTEVRKSLGAVEPRQPAATRGHLQMAEVNPEIPFNGGDDWNNYQVLDAAFGLTPYNQSYFMCTHCEHNYADGTLSTDVNPALADIFNDIIVHSNRPALAIQAVFTTLCAVNLRLPTVF